jgi:hypothetical protein
MSSASGDITMTDLLQVLEAAENALKKVQVNHRASITIGPIDGERFAHVKMTSDHWPVSEEWELLRRFALARIAILKSKAALRFT